MRKSLQRGPIQLVGSTEVVDDSGHCTALGRIPGVLGELIVPDGRAVGIAALRGAQVRAYPIHS